jgi:hypothetical protein
MSLGRRRKVVKELPSDRDVEVMLQEAESIVEASK